VSAREEAIEAMVAVIAAGAKEHPIDLTGITAWPVLPLGDAIATALDAIPPSVLAQLAIERGGLEQVGWQRAAEHDETIHRLRRTTADAKRRGERPVYRLAAATEPEGNRPVHEDTEADSG
jgi:hypothetical protein